jgi:4-alpha-glucanotransferase
VIAEDLGVITPAVEQLRDSLGFPGMVILQWGFHPDPHNVHRISNHVENRIAYTGTHDNDTLRGWWESLPDDERARARAALGDAGLDGDDVWWGLIRLTFGSVARVAMVQAQDVLGLGSEARMNQPGKASGAWKWRMPEGALTLDHAARLRAATEDAGRL